MEIKSFLTNTDPLPLNFLTCRRPWMHHHQLGGLSISLCDRNSLFSWSFCGLRSEPAVHSLTALLHKIFMETRLFILESIAFLLLGGFSSFRPRSSLKPTEGKSGAQSTVSVFWPQRRKKNREKLLTGKLDVGKKTNKPWAAASLLVFHYSVKVHYQNQPWREARCGAGSCVHRPPV